MPNSIQARLFFPCGASTVSVPRRNEFPILASTPAANAMADRDFDFALPRQCESACVEVERDSSAIGIAEHNARRAILVVERQVTARSVILIHSHRIGAADALPLCQQHHGAITNAILKTCVGDACCLSLVRALEVTTLPCETVNRSTYGTLHCVTMIGQSRNTEKHVTEG